MLPKSLSTFFLSFLSALLLMISSGVQAADQSIVLTQEEAVQKAKEFYDTKGEWAGKFTITKVHRVRFEQSGPQSLTVHVQYQAGFLQDLSRTVEDQRTFGFQYHNDWKVNWMGPHKSARF